MAMMPVKRTATHCLRARKEKCGALDAHICAQIKSGDLRKRVTLADCCACECHATPLRYQTHRTGDGFELYDTEAQVYIGHPYSYQEIADANRDIHNNLDLTARGFDYHNR